MARIFISYSRQDEAFARRLAGSLSYLGADVWIDVDDIPAGMKWSSAIQQGLDTADLMIVIMSPDSMASKNVEDEWQYYLDNRKPVIPVLLKPAKIHFQLNRIQYIDFQRQPYDPALGQLYAELRRNGLQLNPLLSEAERAQQPVPHFYPAPATARKTPRSWLPLAILGLIGGLVIVAGVVGLAVGSLLSNPQSSATPPVVAQVTDTPQQTTVAVLPSPLAASVVPPSPTVLVTPPPPQATATLPGFTRITRNTDWTPLTRAFGDVEMVLVPAGCFTMGSAKEQLDMAYPLCDAALGQGQCRKSQLFEDEHPATQAVCFDRPFWLDRTEVTNRAYGSPGVFVGDTLPRTNVAWQDAEAHCERRGGRLPTEAEWEYAARGPAGLIFPWGNSFEGGRANYCDAGCEFQWRDRNINDGWPKPAPVGSYPGGASWVGALDMAGNVWEWTSSIYRPYPYNPRDGRENNADVSPKRTLRGGSWNWLAAELRGATRDDYAGNNASSDWYGFRCARDFQASDLPR
jgi:formylglycine-generating enzyme required for sulfatase activity